MAHVADAGLSEFESLGFTSDQIEAVLELLVKGRGAGRTTESQIDLVTSGPEALAYPIAIRRSWFASSLHTLRSQCWLSAMRFIRAGTSLRLWRNVTCPPETSPAIMYSKRLENRKGNRIKKANVERAIQVLREVEVLQSQGVSISEACRKIGVGEHSYYRWKREYGRLEVDQAKRLKELETENARLKKLVADAELDKAILREAASGNC